VPQHLHRTGSGERPAQPAEEGERHKHEQAAERCFTDARDDAIAQSTAGNADMHGHPADCGRDK
jgi:hypothetical protein